MELEAGGEPGVEGGYTLPGNLQAAKGPSHSMLLDSRCSLTALQTGEGLVVKLKPWEEPALVRC